MLRIKRHERDLLTGHFIRNKLHERDCINTCNNVMFAMYYLTIMIYYNILFKLHKCICEVYSAKIETSLHISGKIYRKRKGLLLWIKKEKQVHSFLYQNQLIATGYIVNFSRDNRSREVGVKIKNHKNSERCYWMFRDGISIRNMTHPVILVSTQCGHHLHECM